MDTRDFTVLLSVYWQEKPEYLFLALKSIYQDQTLKPSEIVLVKDGPLTPELDKIINDFTREAPVRVVPLSKNHGLGKALNEGLKYCTNELVARMDTDDISYPHRFEIQVEYMLKHPETAVMSGRIDEFSGEMDNIRSRRIIPENHKNIVEMARKRNPVNHVAAIFRKDAVLKSNGYMDFWQFEDYYLWARMIHDGAIFHNTAESLVAVRFSGFDITRRHGLKYACNEFRFLKELHRLGIMQKTDMLINVPIRFTLRLVPKWILYKIYMVFLR